MRTCSRAGEWRRKETEHTHAHPSATQRCRAGTLRCRAWSGWLGAPASGSHTHAESKRLPLVGLELPRPASVSAGAVAK